MKGSIPPTGRDSIELVWQFRVKREGDSADLDFTFPLPVFSMQVATQASPEMTLEVDTMPAGVVREGLPQRVLITGRTMRDPSDPPLDRIRVHLRGIPPDAGPARWWSVILSAVLGVGALGAFVWRRRNASAARSDVPTTTPAELEAQRDAVLEEIRALTREHLAGEVGPETFAKRKRELAKQLAEVLRELDAALTREKQDLPYRAPKSSKRVNKS
jgi:hypothetical protein